MKKFILVLLFFYLSFCFPGAVYAHAFGQLYILPIPVWMYIFGGGLTLIISFIIIGVFINEKKSRFVEQSIDVSKSLAAKIISADISEKVMQVLSLGLWVLVLVAGFIGDQTPTNNLMPLFFWVFFLLGGIYLTILVGNFWKVVSPIYILVSFLRKYITVVPFHYPEAVGFIPALVFYYLLVWMELLSKGWATIPHVLSSLLLSYCIFQIIAAMLIGEKWLEYGELFTVLFGVLGKMSPLYIHNKKVKVQFPFIGLVQDFAYHKTLLLFVLFMLSSTAFDGLRSTVVWRPIQYAVYPLLGFLSRDPFFIFPIVQSIALFVSPFVFLSLYILAIYVMKRLTKSTYSLTKLSLTFTLSLLPIALAYNVAHYFTLVISSFQSLMMIISDPFNKGWDLFHTAHINTNPQILRATTIWYTEVAAIVGGHIIAVYIAHLIALKIFPSHKQAVLSQVPILILMVVYTITGLWILSQPLTIGF